MQSNTWTFVFVEKAIAAQTFFVVELIGTTTPH